MERQRYVAAGMSACGLGGDPAHVVPSAQGFIADHGTSGRIQFVQSAARETRLIGIILSCGWLHIADNHLLALHDHDAIHCSGIVGSAPSAPAERFHLKDLGPVGQLDQPL